MTDKLTDKEIVKALECCASGDDGCEKGCPLNYACTSPIKTMENLIKFALDLINRLEKENDRKDKNYIDLLKTSSERADIISEQNAEIERLKNHIQEGIDLAKQIPEMIATVKAEAYKEFAEKANEIIDLLVDLMFDDSISKCQLPSCHKPSSIPCENEICIQKNKEFWHGKLDNLLKEMVGENNET